MALGKSVPEWQRELYRGIFWSLYLLKIQQPLVRFMEYESLYTWAHSVYIVYMDVEACALSKKNLGALNNHHVTLIAYTSSTHFF